MIILLVAATRAEIAPLLEAFGFVKQDRSFSSGKYRNLTMDVLITGPGMTATAYHLGKVLPQKPYDVALNVGIAGSFSRDLAPGEVVNVVKDEFADLGAEDGAIFLDLFELGLAKEDEPPFVGGKLKASYTYKGLKAVNGLTVNTVHGNEDSIGQLMKRYPADVESMEGAAFYYCCLMEGVPCSQIRAISNYVEPRNREAWDIPLAVKNLSLKLKDLFE